MRVERVQDDEGGVDGEAAHLRGRAAPLVHLAAGLPDEVTRPGVERVDHVAGVGDVHDAVMHDRGRLRHPRLEPPGPGELELPDVVPVDLLERAVAPPIEGASPAQPVGRVGVLQHRVGDRREVLGVRPTGEPGGERETRDDDEVGTRPHADLLGRLDTRLVDYTQPIRRMSSFQSPVNARRE